MKSFLYLLILTVAIGVGVSCEKEDSTGNSDETYVIQDETCVIQDETKSETISSSNGGEIVMSSGVKVKIPANAFSADKHITVETIDPTLVENKSKLSEDIKGVMVSAVVRCSPEGTTFEGPVEITIPYCPDMFPKNTTINDIVVASYAGDSIELASFIVDSSKQVVIAETMHFSDFVVLSEKGILVYKGKIYNTVVINGVEWMAENLAYLPTVNHRTDISSFSPKYYVFDYDGTDRNEAMSSENYTKYGVIYNWTGALEACPQGWRVPSKEDWEGLINFIYEQRGPFEYLEEAGKPVTWYDLPKHLKANEGWTVLGGDDFRFSAKPGAGTDSNGTFYSVIKTDRIQIEMAEWWSSTIASHKGDNFAYYLSLTDLYRYSDGYQLSTLSVQESMKRIGLNVRCIKVK